MHATDGELRALLDGEVLEPRRAHIERHLATCEVCAARRAELHQDQAAAASLLDLFAPHDRPLDVDQVLRRVRGRRTARPGLIAAAIALCIATVAGATVGRPYVRALATQIGRLVRSDDKPAPRVESLQGGIALVPGPRLDVVFDARQQDGVLVITVADGAELWIRATAAVPYRVGAGSIRIDNRGSSANYEVVLPRAAGEVRITVAGRVAFAKSNSQIVSPVAVDSAGRYVLAVR